MMNEFVTIIGRKAAPTATTVPIMPIVLWIPTAAITMFNTGTPNMAPAKPAETRLFFFLIFPQVYSRGRIRLVRKNVWLEWKAHARFARLGHLLDMLVYSYLTSTAQPDKGLNITD